MIIRILFLIFGFILVSNLILISVGVVMGTNLYEKFGKQILNFYIGFILLIVILFIILSIVGLL